MIVKSDRHGQERVRCQIVEGGVLYAGTTYKSLSAAAVAAARDLGLATKTLNGWAWWGIAKPARATTTKKSAADALAQLFDRYREKATAAIAGASACQSKAGCLKPDDAASREASTFSPRCPRAPGRRPGW